MRMKWYEEKDAENDVIVASRIRLLRNLRDYKFPWKLEEEDAAIALPLIVLGTLAVFFFAISMRHPRSSILSQAVILVAEIGIYSVCVELLTRHYYAVPMTLSWSAIVLTCAIIIDVTLVTILLRSRLREEVRRRMHI